MRGKTITTYLITGNPKGPKTVFISNQICKAFVLPRAKLSDVESRKELHQPSLYFLISESEEKIYVGETEDFLLRVKHHDLNKSFWELAVVFISKDNDLTKSDIKYLEYLALLQIKESDRYNLDENKTNPKPTNLPEHQIASIDEFFDDVKLLTTFLGFPAFEQVQVKNKVLFYCSGRKSKAQGIYDENGFTVLKGSIVPMTVTPSFKNGTTRREVLSVSAEEINGGLFCLKKDIVFKSPSSASSFCIGNPTNGWISWRTESHETLDEVFRSKLSQ